VLEILLKTWRDFMSVEQVQFCPEKVANFLVKWEEVLLPKVLFDPIAVLSSQACPVSSDQTFTHFPNVENLQDEAVQWAVELLNLTLQIAEAEFNPTRPIFSTFGVGVCDIPANHRDQCRQQSDEDGGYRLGHQVLLRRRCLASDQPAA
jgi:hypothetical protein